MDETDTGTGTSLREECAAIYDCLLRSGELTLDGIAAALEQPESRFRPALERLLELQLIQVTCERYSAIPPRLATALFIGTREADLHVQSMEIRRALSELASAKDEISTFASSYYQARARQSDSPLQALDDGKDVQALLNAATENCRSEVMTCQPGGKRPSSILKQALPRDLALLDRGVRLRTIYQHTAQFDGPTIDYAAAVTAAGSQIRIASEIPSRMIIFDREIAVLPHREHPSGAIVIREPSAVLTLCKVFEFIWGAATPYASDCGGDSDGELPDLDLKIVQLMADGLTDAAIGARLGMSDRAVRKHASLIYQHLGAKSRFQAGAIAGQRGLVASA